MTMVQTSQNKMLRTLDGALDQKSTKIPLDNQNMLSVNQTAAQIKLNEMRKATPLLTIPNKNEDKRKTRKCH
jgi:hypothetical protein